MKTIIRYLSLAALIVASATAQVAVKYNSSGQLTEPATLKVTGTKKISFESGGTLSAAGSVGTAGQLLQSQGPGVAPQWVSATGGAGDFNGPASSTDNALVRFDGAGGKTSQNSLAVLDDSGNLSGIISIPGTVALGATGPRLDSSLASRGLAQALVFDGTGLGTLSGVPALGKKWTAAFWHRPTAINTYNTFIYGATGSLYVYYGAGGSIYILKNGQAPTIILSDAVVVNEEHLWTITADGTTMTLYKDGVVVATGADSQDYDVAPTQLGGIPGSEYITGKLRVALWNRTLSASEVDALSEGTISGADYNSASNTSLVTGDDSTFAGGLGSWAAYGPATLTNPAANLVITSTAAIATNGASLANTLVVGKKYKAVFTGSVGSGTQAFRVDSAANEVTLTTTPTEFTVEFTATATTLYLYWNNPDTSVRAVTIDTVTLYPLGLLLSPDWANGGAGLTAYPQTGTSGTITLPASGVTWAQPKAATVPFTNILASGTGYFGSTVRGTNSTQFEIQAYTGADYKPMAFDALSYTWQTSGGTAGMTLTGSDNLEVVGSGTFGSGGNTVTLQAGSLTAIPTTAAGIVTSASAPQVRLGSRSAGRSNLVLDSTAGRVWNFENTGTSLTLGYAGLDAMTLAETTGNATFAGSVAAAVAEYADNAAAVTAGLPVGTFYRTGDVLKVVH